MTPSYRTSKIVEGAGGSTFNTPQKNPLLISAVHPTSSWGKSPQTEKDNLCRVGTLEGSKIPNLPSDPVVLPYFGYEINLSFFLILGGPVHPFHSIKNRDAHSLILPVT